MGLLIGAIKYFIGMGTSVWGIITAFLFAQTLLEPLDYIEGALLIGNHHDDPQQLMIGFFEIFITTPSNFVKTVFVGLAVMSVLWVIGMMRSQ